MTIREVLNHIYTMYHNGAAINIVAEFMMTTDMYPHSPITPSTLRWLMLTDHHCPFTEEEKVYIRMVDMP